MYSFCYTSLHNFACLAVSPVPSLFQRINQLLCHGQQKESPDDSGIGAKEAGSSATKLSQGEQKAVARIDNIIKNFKDHDIEGTLKDMAGDPVPRKNGSGYYDHLIEMQERIRGLANHAETLKNVSNPEAQAARQAALDTLKRISDSLNGAGI